MQPNNVRALPPYPPPPTHPATHPPYPHTPIPPFLPPLHPPPPPLPPHSLSMFSSVLGAPGLFLKAVAAELEHPTTGKVSSSCGSSSGSSNTHHTYPSHLTGLIVTSHVCITRMHHMYASHICTTCMPHTYASNVLHHTYAPHVCTTRMHHMYASHICITRMHHTFHCGTLVVC